jgi:hypothetical protein
MVSTYILDPLTSIFAWNLGPFVRKTHFVHRPIFARNLGDSTGWLESVRGIEERAWWAGDDLNPVPIDGSVSTLLYKSFQVPANS